MLLRYFGHIFIVLKEIPYLEYPLFVHDSESLSLLVPCSKPTAPLQPPPLFPSSSPSSNASSRQYNIYLHTDDVNKPPSSSGGHKFLIIILFKMAPNCLFGIYREKKKFCNLHIIIRKKSN
jgi:hypothetical protein